MQKNIADVVDIGHGGDLKQLPLGVLDHGAQHDVCCGSQKKQSDCFFYFSVVTRNNPVVHTSGVASPKFGGKTVWL